MINALNERKVVMVNNNHGFAKILRPTTGSPVVESKRPENDVIERKARPADGKFAKILKKDIKDCQPFCNSKK